jgi:hypothetical protein
MPPASGRPLAPRASQRVWFRTVLGDSVSAVAISDVDIPHARRSRVSSWRGVSRGSGLWRMRTDPGRRPSNARMRTPTICCRSEVAGAGTHTTEMSASVDEDRLEVGRLTVSNGTAELGFGARARLRETASVKWRLRSSAFRAAGGLLRMEPMLDQLSTGRTANKATRRTATRKLAGATKPVFKAPEQHDGEAERAGRGLSAGRMSSFRQYASPTCRRKP